MKTAGIVIGCIVALMAIFAAADFVGDALGLRHLDDVTGYLLGLACTAGILAGIYLPHKHAWSWKSQRPRFVACVALSAISAFIAIAMRDPNSSCFVDWDGRSNTSVCE